MPPGVGCLDLDGIVDALAGIGFNGTITLDLYGYPLPEEGSRTSIRYLRKVIERLGI
jgi:sugar phosphate isomerase/epimerase